ncbi:Long-chain-fatty-acid--CoA ligase [hydrothermal vent metagenome]|uniref:Long-chain-fatty-acid--CoA ligase n=1 Tax=hydrothermal vent metagenome TaxID=652676 RepID=A0A3B0U1I2_9ZZZZ
MGSIFARAQGEYRNFTGTVRMFMRLIPILKRPRRTIGDQIADLARRHGDREALIQGQTVLTFADLDARANAYARWAMAQGIVKGDVVALHMGNRPEFMVAWIGLARAGAVVALINTNQVGAGLAHSYRIVAPKAIVLGAEMAHAFATARDQLDPCPPVWIEGGKANGRDLGAALDAMSPALLSAAERPDLTIDDLCLYIYTSGTTGLPKAASISHYRVLAIMNGFSAVMGARKSDRMYVTLPLYHSSGGLLAAGAALTVGGATIIRTQFSASAFWSDIVRHEATMFQYIGELCRFLLNAPESNHERAHKIRLCCGNGLRPDIWEDFQRRFALPRIIEFYGATEGNVVLVNHDGKVGSVGRIPFWARPLFHTEVIRFDMDSGEPVRGPDGRCQICDPDEVGEVIGEVRRGTTAPTSRFDGYADKRATSSKVLRDVFAKDDTWFRTGDLMRRDAAGYFYFIDRIGDTFRWKGENVSTTEVAGAMSAYPGVAHVIVYGVAVPGHDGRAGMAAIVSDSSGVDLAGMPDFLAARLPAYARPRFVRVRPEMDITSTFKQRKFNLVADGFDPTKGGDPVYFSNTDGGEFRQMTRQHCDDIGSGKIKL